MKVACITTLNEEATIAGIVGWLLSTGFAVIVGDAASTDGTAYNARAAGAELLELGRIPIGTAMMACWRRGLEIYPGASVLQMDAGGSHLGTAASGLVLGLRSSDMVIGSRFLPGAFFCGSHWRKLRSRAMAAACNLASASRFTDWGSGFRAFRPELVRELLRFRYRTSMHTWQAEVLANAIACGARIDEVPITYLAGRSSASLRLVPDIMRVLWAMA